MKPRNFYLLLLLLTILYISFSFIDSFIDFTVIKLTTILIIFSYLILFISIINYVIREYKTKRNYQRFMPQHFNAPLQLFTVANTDLVMPKEIVPYEFYCSCCKETYFGFMVYCPQCGRRMQQPRLKKNDSVEKKKCVLCYKENCPTCDRKLVGENTCQEECPYCGRIYHQHCWEKTIKTFGKCGFCLEIPPSEMIRQIFKATSLDQKPKASKRRYQLSKPIDLFQVKQQTKTRIDNKQEEIVDSSTKTIDIDE